MFASLPNTAVAQVLGKQVLRSGTSVGANYREASRARSKAEFISKCGDALRELEEVIDSGVVGSLSSLLKECDELTAIFVTIINRARGQINSAFYLLPSYFPLRS
jgi:four helix bundle protein